jgi:hypothetical protein
MKIEILLCFQEMSKNDELMMSYFCKDDLELLRKFLTSDSNSLDIDENIKRLIQVLLNSSNLGAQVDHIKNNVRKFCVLYFMIEMC